MKKIFTILSVVLLFVSCDKPFEMDLPLSVAQRKISLAKSAGSTHVLVYADGAWSAAFTEPVKWASINKLSGYGNSDIVFSYSENYGIARKVGLVLTKDDLRDTVFFSQAGLVTSPNFTVETSEVDVLQCGGTASVFAESNLFYCAEALYAYAAYTDASGNTEEVLVSGDDGNPAHWIRSFTPSYDKFTFEVAANPSGELREVVLKIGINDPSGASLRQTVTVRQSNAQAKLSLGGTTTFNYDAKAQSVRIPLNENTVSAHNPSVYVNLDDTPWITNFRIAKDGIRFNLMENNTPETLFKDVNLTFISADGKTTTLGFYIMQAPK